MRTKTIETRWNECKKYFHIIHFALSLSSEPLSEGEFSGSNYGRKVSKEIVSRICRQGVAVVVLGVWIMYT